MPHDVSLHLGFQRKTWPPELEPPQPPKPQSPKPQSRNPKKIPKSSRLPRGGTACLPAARLEPS